VSFCALSNARILSISKDNGPPRKVLIFIFSGAPMIQRFEANGAADDFSLATNIAATTILASPIDLTYEFFGHDRDGDLVDLWHVAFDRFRLHRFRGGEKRGRQRSKCRSPAAADQTMAH
jgi:hypothetical protein